MNHELVRSLCWHDTSAITEVEEKCKKALKWVHKVNKEPATDMTKIDELCRLCLEVSMAWALAEKRWKEIHPEYVFDEEESIYDHWVTQLWKFARENSIDQKDDLTVQGSPLMVEYYLEELAKSMKQIREEMGKDLGILEEAFEES